MARNGSGTYSLLVNSWNPAVAGVSATVADWQSLINDVASALTLSLAADGQTALTGNLNFNSNKATNLSNASATGHAIVYGQGSWSLGAGTLTGALTATSATFAGALSGITTLSMSGALTLSGGPIRYAAEVDVASAATLDISAITSNQIRITGTTNISAITSGYIGPIMARFAGVLTLVHGANLLCPNSTSITTAAGDSCTLMPNPAGSGWIVWDYSRFSGVPLTPTAAASQSDVDTGTDLTKFINSGLNRVSLKTLTATTSGTSVDFTSLPAGTRRITLSFNGVSTSGTSALRVRLGTGGTPETSGYLGSSGATSGAGATTTNFTAGFDLNDGASASVVRHGSLTFTLMDSATNLWAVSGVVGRSDGTGCMMVGGIKPLAGALDMVRVTTVGGADTFDAGSVNIAYER